MKILLFLLFLPTLSFACSCNRTDNLLFNYDNAKQVFLIEVKDRSNEFIETEEGILPPPPVEWCFEVDLIESFKGSQQLQMIYNVRFSSCSYSLVVGKQYLFYLNQEDDFLEFRSSLCDRNVSNSDKEFDSELNFLRFMKEKNSTQAIDINDTGNYGLNINGQLKNGERVGRWCLWRYEDQKRLNVFLLEYEKGRLKRLSYTPSKHQWLSNRFDKIRVFYESQIIN